jgi:hypothetical protein
MALEPDGREPTKRTRNFILSRIGPHDRMRDLVENGNLILRRLSTYVKLENRVIGDPDEGLFARYTAENPSLKFTFSVGERQFPLEAQKLTINSTARNHGVLCMCGIPSKGDGVLYGGAILPIAQDKRMLEFGDTLVFFKDSPEFVRRLEAAALATGYELDARPVAYVPSVYCGDMGPFRKLDSYAYQREWRFLTTAPISGEKLELNLGSLLDITKWIDLEGLHKQVAAISPSKDPT